MVNFIPRPRYARKRSLVLNKYEAAWAKNMSERFGENIFVATGIFSPPLFLL
jgi:hypothetical protein